MKSRSGLQNPSFFTMLIRVGKSLSVKIQHPENNARRSIAGIHQRSIPCQKKKHRKWALNLRQTTWDSHNFNKQHEHVFHESSCHWAKPEIKHKDATGKVVCSARTYLTLSLLRRMFCPHYCNSYPPPGLKLLLTSVAPKLLKLDGA